MVKQKKKFSKKNQFDFFIKGVPNFLSQKKMQQQQEQHKPYEGAGFILKYKDNIVLGLRIKKPADFAKDPTQEVEYMGGKPDKEDGDDPLQTAYAELVEELGGTILDSNWRQHVNPIHIFQPFSKKWIWCLLYQLNDAEFVALKQVAAQLNDTNKWGKSFSHWTGRATPVSRAIESIYLCPLSEVSRYMSGFKKVLSSDNRLNDAKKYREQDKLAATHLLTGENASFPLRAFNAVMWEQHVEKIVNQ